MKDIKELMKGKELVIDPSIELENVLDELVRNFKVKIISYSDNEEVLTNIYFVMKTYFSDAVVDDIIKSCLDKSAEPILIKGLRNKKIDELLK
jgi:hypothetical protein